MNERKTVSKKSKKRNSGLIIGFLNFINDFIMNGLTTGFFSKVFSANINYDRLERESLSLGMSSDTPEGKKKSAKRYIHKRYDESTILGAVRRLVRVIRSCRLNVFGSYMMTFGIYSLVVFFIKYVSVNGAVDKYLFFEEAFLGSLLMILLSIPLFVSKKNVSLLFGESVVIRGLFEDALGVAEEKFASVERSTGAMAYFVAVILGILSGGLSFFISPVMIFLGLIALLAVGVVLHFPELGVLIAIFAAPLLGFFKHPTVIMIVMVAVTFTSYMIKVVIGKRYMKFGFTDAMVMLFAALLMFGGIITSGGIPSLTSALTYVAFIAVYFLVVNLMNTREWLERCVDTIALPSALVALFGILSYTNVQMPGAWVDSSMFSEISNRAISTFANPNMLATYLILTAPFLWMNVRDRRASKSGKIFSLIGSVISFVCVVLTWSRGGWIGYLAAFLIYMIINCRRTFKYLFMFGAVAPLGLLAVPQSVASRFLSIGNLADSSSYFRLHTWKGSLRMLYDHFWGGIGVGTNAFNQIYPIYSYVGTESAVHSHNLFLEIAIELGIAGLAVFVIIMIGVVRKGFGSLRIATHANSRLAISAGLAGLIAALTHGMVDYIWYNYRVFFMFWVVAALVCAYSRVEGSISEYKSTDTSDASGNEATLNIIFREN